MSGGCPPHAGRATTSTILPGAPPTGTSATAARRTDTGPPTGPPGLRRAGLRPYARRLAARGGPTGHRGRVRLRSPSRGDGRAAALAVTAGAAVDVERFHVRAPVS
ncbi:hypothetical protein [Streptomyces sp. IBSBF 2806]|uniref:hypothetical protein n=1 Tax=Streptomyces sp. IBSBF 2806 TaxID=2903529 RepID=UPI002FDBE3FB